MSVFVINENFDIEGPEKFIEIRVWIRVVVFGGEGECEYDRDPS